MPAGIGYGKRRPKRSMVGPANLNQKQRASRKDLIQATAKRLVQPRQTYGNSLKGPFTEEDKSDPFLGGQTVGNIAHDIKHRKRLKGRMVRKY